MFYSNRRNEDCNITIDGRNFFDQLAKSFTEYMKILSRSRLLQIKEMIT